MNDDMPNDKKLEQLIADVVERPRRSEPRIDVKDIVMRRIAEEPPQVYEKDLSIWGLVFGIAVLIALAVFVDKVFLPDLAETWELSLSDTVDGEFAVPYMDVLFLGILIPLVWLILQEPKRSHEEVP